MQEASRIVWVDAFSALRKQSTFESVLLRNRLPLILDGERLSPSVVERASGVLASHLPQHLIRGENTRLIFVVPKATQSLGRFLAVSLLLADFVQRQEKNSALIEGDVLLITQHIRNCVDLLSGVALRFHSEKLVLRKFWPIEVLSQYAPPVDSTPRVFVANPGWRSVLGNRRAFGLVVIDVSHPRTSDHLEPLLKQLSIASAPFQILVIPPWDRGRIDALSEKGRASNLIWAWDPAAVEAIEEVLATKPFVSSTSPTKRFLWLSDDTEVNEDLVALHSLLVGAMKAGNGQVPEGVLGAWGTYHKLRQLSVPLVVLEEERRKAYQTLTVQERIQSLEEEQPEARGPMGAYLDSRWPRIVSTLKSLYDVLLHRHEPAKFYTLASVVEHLLKTASHSGMFRIVAPTAHEGNLVASLLGEIVEEWPEALQSGAVSLTTVKEEPRLIAEGSVLPTVLLGFRKSETRYLDVYPGIPIHVVAYPYEAEVDDKIQERIHSSIESLEGNSTRVASLKQLHMRIPSVLGSAQKLVTNEAPMSKRAISQRHFEAHPPLQQRSFLDDEIIEPLSLQKIAGQDWFEEIQVSPAVHPQIRRGTTGVEYCEIAVTNGERYRYPISRLVSVFRPGADQKERLAAGELEPGMLIVVLVDDPYDDIFQRMLEATHEHMDNSARIALALWGHAKAAALTRHGGNRTSLHRSLEANGLSVEYPAVVGWYRSGEDEILAPSKREDFEILARESRLYSDPARILATFNCIHHERVVRRTCGRQLSNLLSYLAAGKHYEVALKSADAIGTALEQVAAAVSLQEVESVRILGKENLSWEDS